MTKPGNFILRWARLKRQSDIEPVTDTSRNGSAMGPKETVLALSEATATQPRIDAGADEPLDPSGLHRLKRSLPTRASADFCNAACPPN